eukprot:543808-Ditylum_brightwellii.AAC.1
MANNIMNMVSKSKNEPSREQNGVARQNFKILSRRKTADQTYEIKKYIMSFKTPRRATQAEANE